MKIDGFESDRLVFREIMKSDSDFIVKLRADESVYCFFKNPHRITLDEHIKWYNDSYFQNNKRFDFIILEKNTNNKVGVVGFNVENNIEINYIIEENFQGRGYGFESISQLIKVIENLYPNYPIIAIIHKDNFKSIGLIKKVGFCFVFRDGNFDTYMRDL